ncbi:DUF4326 domain-containing protein [Nodosilinea nodulosa]|uniref:DUF4326 domain-containing protein n=1 Tax=Nodosilinea nodulosa TaxID=416001 RepID=UPI0018C34D2A|nr:DUF4326 domain-containing protein [Nodosilinea nodulosa]
MIITTIGSTPLAHYIGRGGKGKAQSALANPFPVGRTVADRKQCVKLFRAYIKLVLKDRMQPQAAAEYLKAELNASTVANFHFPTRQAVLDELRSLDTDSQLGCFCYKENFCVHGILDEADYPFNCHGEVVASSWYYATANNLLNYP